MYRPPPVPAGTPKARLRGEKSLAFDQPIISAAIPVRKAIPHTDYVSIS